MPYTYSCKFWPSHSHPHRSAFAKHRFSVTPGTCTFLKLFDKQTKKITEPEQGWFRHQPLLSWTYIIFSWLWSQPTNLSARQALFLACIRIFTFRILNDDRPLIYNQMLPRQVRVADEILILFYSCRSTSSHGCSHGCRVWLSSWRIVRS